jgi:glycosyltransferase involved in cell wall biosynthesis
VSLLFDLSGAQYRRANSFNGGAEYVKAVLKRLLERLPSGLDLQILLQSGKILDSEVQDWIGQRYRTWTFARETEVPGLIRASGAAVFFSGMPYSYKISSMPGCRLVYTVHGLRELECQDDRYHGLYLTGGLKEWLRWKREALFPQRERKSAVARFRGMLDPLSERDLIVAVSEHTRTGLKYHVPSVQAPVRVWASPPKPVAGAPDPSLVPLQSKYFLMVSGNRWIKNAMRGIAAFDRLLDRPQSPVAGMKMVVTGGLTKPMRSRIRHRDAFIILDYTTAEQLAGLMQNAWALFYPSLNEGFGYPPLEAMQWGTPVLTSAATSLTEVCGNGAMFFNPYSEMEMQYRLIAMADPEVRKAHSAAGLQWQRSMAAKQERDLEALVGELIGADRG